MNFERAALKAEITDAVDHVRNMTLRTRHALLHFYKGKDPSRLLGPPYDLGGRHRPDELSTLRAALLQAGIPSMPLAAVMRAEDDFSAFFLQYEAGDFARTTIETFRADVERIFALVAQALDGADSWLTTWPAEPAVPTLLNGPRKSPRPRLALLDEQTDLSTDDLAEALGVVVEVARRRMSRGDFGAVTKVGQRNYVRSEAVRAALRGGENAQR